MVPLAASRTTAAAHLCDLHSAYAKRNDSIREAASRGPLSGIQRRHLLPRRGRKTVARGASRGFNARFGSAPEGRKNVFKRYALTDTSGSHHIFRKPGARPLSVPVHHGQVKYVDYKKAQKHPASRVACRNARWIAQSLSQSDIRSSSGAKTVNGTGRALRSRARWETAARSRNVSAVSAKRLPRSWLPTWSTASRLYRRSSIRNVACAARRREIAHHQSSLTVVTYWRIWRLHSIRCPFDSFSRLSSPVADEISAASQAPRPSQTQSA